MTHGENMEFIHIIANQPQNLNDELLAAFRAVKNSIDYIATWIEDFHNEFVYTDDDEKFAMYQTFRKITAILEEEIQ
jgi:hypothetical protein